MEKQQIRDVSFPGLPPNTVHGLIPKGSTVKTNTKMDGFSDTSRDWRPRCSGILLERRPAQDQKGELASSQAARDCPECGTGAFWFRLLHLLAPWPKFVRSSGYLPIPSGLPPAGSYQFCPV